jgi:hypothetical protein
VTNDVSDWLANLGMSEYVEPFAENGIAQAGDTGR